MRTGLFNVVLPALVLALTATSYADSALGFTVVGMSRDGSAISRTEERTNRSPAESQPNAMIHVYRLSEDKSQYTLLRTIEHVQRYAPNVVVLTRNAEYVVTFDSSVGIGMGGEVVVVYDSTGKAIRKWTLEQILQASDLTRVPRTVSSRWWRTEVMVADGDTPKVMVTGPKPLPISNQPVKSYGYVLDLVELKWTKL